MPQSFITTSSRFLLLLQLILSSIAFFNVGCQNQKEITHTNFHGKQNKDGIFGGERIKTDSRASKAIVAISLRDRFNNERICSGVLLTYDLVLTASHCVNKDLANIQVYFLNDIEERLSPNFKESRQVTDFKISDQEKGSLALLKLNKMAPTDSSFFELPTEADRPLNLKIAGFGAESFSRVTRITTGDSTLKFTKAIDLNIDDDSNRFVTLRQDLGQGACVGDSGGPLYLEDSGRLVLFGIAYNVQNLESEDLCRGISNYSRARYFIDWINNAVKDFSLTATSSQIVI